MSSGQSQELSGWVTGDFSQQQPCTVRGRQCKPGLVAEWSRG